MDNFGASAQDVFLDGTILHALLCTKGGVWTKSSLDLDFFVAADGGNFVFRKPHESILLSYSCFSLQKFVLHALCLGPDGRFYHSEIDLNNYWANKRGALNSDNKDIYCTARSVRLDTSKGVFLYAELAHYDGRWLADSIDLSVCIVNHGGKLVFERQSVGPVFRSSSVTMG